MTEKKKISIVLAMYKPNIKWLEELLDSLNGQTYPNLELLVWNDCPDDSDHDEIFSKYVTRFPYKIFHGAKNIGSNGAFEKLTELARGEYLAYCDQDDVWLPEKLETLLHEVEASGADLVYSDMYVIDGESRVLADSITKVRRHHIFQPDTEAFRRLLRKNFVTGCTMLVKANIAKKALPFPASAFHDWWLALFASAHGGVHFIHRPLIRYRIYGTNQSSMMGGIEKKRDYYEKRLHPYALFLQDAYRRLVDTERLGAVKQFVDWANIREAYYHRPRIKTGWGMIKAISMGKSVTLFELVLPFLPEFFFRFIIRQIRRNRI